MVLVGKKWERVNSAPKLSVSLEARAQVSLGQSHEALDATRHISDLHLVSNITPPWRGAAQWTNVGPNPDFQRRYIAPNSPMESQPAVLKTWPPSKRPPLMVVWTGLSIPIQRRLKNA